PRIRPVAPELALDPDGEVRIEDVGEAAAIAPVMRIGGPEDLLGRTGRPLVLVAQRVLGGPEECHRRHPLGIGPGTLLAAPAGPRRAVAAVGRPGEHPLVRVLRDGVEAPGAKATDLLG